MSVEVHVFYRGALPSKSALMQTLRALDLSLSFVPGSGPLEKHSGFLPMKWRGEETGFEFDVFSDPETLREYRVDGIDASLDRCAVFHLGGDITELLAAQSVAAALAKLTGGTVYDPEAEQVQTLDEAVAAARSTFETIDKSRRKRPRGTRPADIRHYLKPLLKERPDLILRGRQLFVRPVRHFWRGARFDPIGGTTFGIHLDFQRLYVPPNCISSGYIRGVISVWTPYFAPWLFDLLRHDVFPLAAPVTGLGDLGEFDHRAMNEYNRSTDRYCVLDYVLAGERDRAAALIEEREGRWYRSVIEMQRAYLERNIEELCAECHKQERETVKALGLEAAWEPTPFPAELPKASRRQQSGEVAFEPTPWVTSDPPITTTFPTTPGEIAFASELSARGDSNILINPLTRDQAENLHDNNESYCLVVCLRDHQWLTLIRDSGWSVHDPEAFTRPIDRERDSYELHIMGTSRGLFASFSPHDAPPGLMEIHRLAWGPGDGSRWNIFVKPHDEVVIAEHWRDRKRVVDREQHITEQDRALWRTIPPAFGAYEEMLKPVNALLEFNGLENFVL